QGALYGNGQGLSLEDGGREQQEERQRSGDLHKRAPAVDGILVSVIEFTFLVKSVPAPGRTFSPERGPARPEGPGRGRNRQVVANPRRPPPSLLSSSSATRASHRRICNAAAGPG